MKLTIIFSILTLSVLFSNCTTPKETLALDRLLAYCDSQTNRSIQQIGDTTLMPRYINKDDSVWNFVKIWDWTSGFWPGILWYDYENTGNEEIKQKAEHYTNLLELLSRHKAIDHDLGFQMFCSYGNAYRLTGNEEYKDVILRSADTLATLYNPVAKTLLSWPHRQKIAGWEHNTIVDNLMNLEMLFWASKNGGGKNLYEIAVNHAETTMKNQYREDGGNYHVVLYDFLTGEATEKITFQGYSDNSLWARGQAWSIYGYMMIYRETGKPEFLQFAEKITDLYISRLPDDLIPYWDFDAPDIPNEPRDASAATITASALLELSQLATDKRKADKYMQTAVNILISLDKNGYLSKEKNPSFLLHSTGYKPANSEVDVSINYADYYFLEALLRYKKIKEGKSIYK